MDWRETESKKYVHTYYCCETTMSITLLIYENVYPLRILPRTRLTHGRFTVANGDNNSLIGHDSLPLWFQTHVWGK